MKLKSLILSFALTLFAVSGLLAQDRYEYGTLKIVNSFTSISFTTADKRELFPTKVKDYEFDKDILKKLNELVFEGWEVIGITRNDDIIAYHLRKKKH